MNTFEKDSLISEPCIDFSNGRVDYISAGARAIHTYPTTRQYYTLGRVTLRCYDTLHCHLHAKSNKICNCGKNMILLLFLESYLKLALAQY